MSQTENGSWKKTWFAHLQPHSSRIIFPSTPSYSQRITSQFVHKCNRVCNECAPETSQKTKYRSAAVGQITERTTDDDPPNWLWTNVLYKPILKCNWVVATPLLPKPPFCLVDETISCYIMLHIYIYTYTIYMYQYVIPFWVHGSSNGLP